MQRSVKRISVNSKPQHTRWTLRNTRRWRPYSESIRLCLIELRTQQETNQMLQAQALQQLIGHKVQQDNLKSLFQTGNGYQQNFNFFTPQQTSSGTQWAFHY